MSSGSGEVSVRPMRAVDLDRVVEIAASLTEAPHWARILYLAAIDPLARPKRLTLAAELDGELAGFAVACLVAGEAELESIAVAHEAQRQGIGAVLMVHLVEALRAAHITKVLLEVRASNLPAQGFYHSQGWVAGGRRPRYYADPEEDAVLMELPLTPPGAGHKL